jgi:hypothetical protein
MKIKLLIPTLLLAVLTSCTDTSKNPSEPTEELKTHVLHIEQDWKENSLQVLEWSQSPVWLCHPNWNEIQESHLLQFELYSDSTANLTAMDYQISIKSMNYTHIGDSLMFEVPKDTTWGRDAYRHSYLIWWNPRTRAPINI